MGLQTMGRCCCPPCQVPGTGCCCCMCECMCVTVTIPSSGCGALTCSNTICWNASIKRWKGTITTCSTGIIDVEIYVKIDPATNQCRLYVESVCLNKTGANALWVAIDGNSVKCTTLDYTWSSINFTNCLPALCTSAVGTLRVKCFPKVSTTICECASAGCESSTTTIKATLTSDAIPSCQQFIEFTYIINSNPPCWKWEGYLNFDPFGGPPCGACADGSAVTLTLCCESIRVFPPPLQPYSLSGTCRGGAGFTRTFPDNYNCFSITAGPAMNWFGLILCSCQFTLHVDGWNTCP